MSKKVKIIIIIAVVAVIAGACVYFFYWKPKKEAEEKAKASTPVTDKTTAPVVDPTKTVTDKSSIANMVKKDVTNSQLEETKLALS